MKRLVVFALVLLSFSLPASAAFGAPVAVPFPICTAAGYQSQPAIDGTQVVWSDTRGGIASFDLATRQEKVLCAALGNQWAPDIDGSLVVWEDHRISGNKGDLFTYDLSAGRAGHSLQGTWWEMQPAISGGHVVYTDSVSGNGDGWDIYLWTIGTNPTALCTAAGQQGSPAIDGELVAWCDWDGEQPGIHVYDLTTAEERHLANTYGYGQLEVDNGRVLCMSQAHPGSTSSDDSPVLYDWASQKTVTIADYEKRSAMCTSDLAISGDTVVWAEYPAKVPYWMGWDVRNPKILARNLPSGPIFELCAAKNYYLEDDGLVEAPLEIAMSGDVVVWADDRNRATSHLDIYGCRIPPDATAPSTTLSGAKAGAWYNHAVTLTFKPTDAGGSGVKSTTFRLDGGEWRTGIKVYVSGKGKHRVEYRSTDGAGNIEATRAAAFGIDRVKPTTKAPYPASVVRYGKAVLKYKAADPLPNGGTATVTIKIRNRAGTLVKTLGPYRGKRVNVRLTASFACSLTRGTYRFYVYAKDKASNAQTLPVGNNRLTVR